MAGTMGPCGADNMEPRNHNDRLGDESPSADSARSPMEAHSSYRGSGWSPQRLVFHQNLETFADRVGLLVGLQANGKLSQEAAYSQIRSLWKELKRSKDSLIDGDTLQS